MATFIIIRKSTEEIVGEWHETQGEADGEAIHLARTVGGTFIVAEFKTQWKKKPKSENVGVKYC